MHYCAGIPRFIVFHATNFSAFVKKIVLLFLFIIYTVKNQLLPTHQFFAQFDNCPIGLYVVTLGVNEGFFHYEAVNINRVADLLRVVFVRHASV